VFVKNFGDFIESANDLIGSFLHDIDSEQCRKHKIRCDHEMPVCGRCKRRKLEAQCHYHPAPLTRPTTSPGGVSWKSSDTSQSTPNQNAFT
jgi:hypothetical protein